MYDYTELARTNEVESQERLIPCAYCKFCKEHHPIDVDIMEHEITKKEITLCSCPIKEEILNLDEDLEVEWLTKEEVSEKYEWDLQERDGEGKL